ncbi:MAG: hypothetical protein KDD33_13490 [Bdellovibrionales bacterium]|nr:hypothetical protein [Bdellovibrionales bacterium]
MKTASVWVMAITLYFTAANAWGVSAPRCSSIFQASYRMSSEDIGFSQSFLGVEWARTKTDKLIDKYQGWAPKKGKNKDKLKFLEEDTQADPLPAYRDINGQVRLVDDHHKFFAMSEFAEHGTFVLYLHIVKDYSFPNPATAKAWTPAQMMADLRSNHYIFIHTADKPTYQDLMNLPSSIFDLPNLHERSVMSFVFRSMSFILKGSDFEPMIQLRLAEAMENKGKTVVYGDPYSKESIAKVRDDILNSNQWIYFLLDRMAKDRPADRKKKVRKFLRSHLQ